MRFHNSTPQSLRENVAMQESRRAARRKSAQSSDMEPSTKKQKLLHGALPPTLASAPAQSQIIATTYSRPTDETPKLVDASPLPAHNATDLGPAAKEPKLLNTYHSPVQIRSHHMTDLESSTKNRKPDHRSVPPAHSHRMANHGLAARNSELDLGSLPPAQALALEVTDLGFAAKGSKLSFADLPRAKGRTRASSVDSLRAFAVDYPRRPVKWRDSNCSDDNEFDVVSNIMSTSPDVDVYKYMAAESSKPHSYTCGSSELEVYPTHGLSGETLRAERAFSGAYSVDEQRLHDVSCHSPAPSAAAQIYPVSDKFSLNRSPARDPINRRRSNSAFGAIHRPSFREMTATASLAFGRKPSESCPPPGDQILSLSSVNSTPESPICSSSDHSLRYNTTPATSDQIASNGSDRDARDDTAASILDQIAPSCPGSKFRDNIPSASSSRNPSDGPPRNKGGRPRGRRPRIPKTPKGPTRFQKNHPIKSKVNIDVWENILVFCPPDFLLRARSISSTFRSVLRDDSLIWKKARLNTFGPNMPEPPPSLSEPQYADLVTGTGCQTRGCTSTKARKTYWALQKRLCIECFHKSFLPPRALRRVFEELETSGRPQYVSIARYYRKMDHFLPGMKFDRWDNYQWLGEYDPAPPWGQLYRSGQYTGYPAAAYANFSSELAAFVGSEYDVEQGRFSFHGLRKTCLPPQDAIDAWFEAKRAANDALVPVLQAVENWCETYKRDNQKAGKDLRKSRESFYEEQAELAGLNTEALPHFQSYQAAVAISKPASKQSWKILLPKIMTEYETTKKLMAGRGAESVRERGLMGHDAPYRGFPHQEEDINEGTGLMRD